MISHLKNIFFDMPILAILAIITPTVLEYICKSLELRPPTWLYQELLDRLNIIYMIGKIIKPKYEDFTIFVSNSSKVGTIEKTMIFIDNIEDV